MTAGSPLDRIEADIRGHTAAKSLGEWRVVVSRDDVLALVNVAKAAEAVVYSWGNPHDEAYRSDTYTNGGNYISLQHLIALREALAALKEPA